MSFNNRRQSRDRLLTERLLQLKGDAPLLMSPYSLRLFPPDADVISDEAYLSQARPGNWCFAERESLLPYLQDIEGLIVFKWNKLYPADHYFDLPLSHFVLTDSQAFPGSSHDLITMEIYTHEQPEQTARQAEYAEQAE